MIKDVKLTLSVILIHLTDYSDVKKITYLRDEGAAQPTATKGIEERREKGHNYNANSTMISL